MPDNSGQPDRGGEQQTNPEETWRGIADRLVYAYPYHRAAFIAFNVILTAINIYMGKPWWALWPLLVTGFIFLVHYLIFKASTVDEAWVDDRAADLYDKSYDQGHIRTIAGYHEMETAADRRAAAAREAMIREAKRRRPKPPAK